MGCGDYQKGLPPQAFATFETVQGSLIIHPIHWAEMSNTASETLQR